MHVQGLRIAAVVCGIAFATSAVALPSVPKHPLGVEPTATEATLKPPCRWNWRYSQQYRRCVRILPFPFD